jgi:Rps23 Pro-64 3,4-dihydroxylase Tpa1-like proline 4-hydroxylase
MDNYIYQNNFSIPKLLCDEIIEKYEKYHIFHYQGVTFGGLEKKIKDTTDFIIPKCENEKDDWYKIEQFLYKELEKNLKIYLFNINNKNNYKPENNSNIPYKLLYGQQHTNSFMIQKYEKGVGKYVYHDDGYFDYENNRYRTITFIWYLNDVEEGGETEFNGDFKIQPKKGKLVFFPATWCFPHRGNMPISDDKYIITGWLYKKCELKKKL